jgi:hypothetical protein
VEDECAALHAELEQLIGEPLEALRRQASEAGVGPLEGLDR